MAWADEFTAALGGDYSTHSDPVPYPALYQWYVSQGIPSNVARYMVSNPSYGEGEQRGSDWPYPYRGRAQELSAGQQNRRDEPLQNQLESRLGFDRNISYSPGGNMPWPNLTPQELAAYQMLSGGNPQMGQAQGMNPQLMQAYQAMLAQQQPQVTGQMNPAMGQPTMANMLAARPNASGGMMNLPTPGAGFNPSSNMSTILNNPHLLQLLMSQYGGGAT